MSGNDNQSLEIDPSTGVITTTRPLDREEVDSLKLIVEAQGGIVSDTSAVSLRKSDTTPLICIQMNSTDALKCCSNFRASRLFCLASYDMKYIQKSIQLCM